MSDYFGSWEPTQTSRKSPVETGHIEDQYSIDLSDGMNGDWSSATGTDIFQSSLRDFSRTHYSPLHSAPDISFNHQQESDVHREYGDPTRSFLQPGHKDPAQFPDAGVSCDEPPTWNMFDEQDKWLVSDDNYQATPLEYASGQQLVGSHATMAVRNEYGPAGCGDFGQSSMMSTNDGHFESCPPMLDIVKDIPVAPELRLDNVFVPEVLKRRQDHRQLLTVFVDHVSTDGRLLPDRPDMAAVTNPDPFDSPSGSHPAIVQRPFFWPPDGVNQKSGQHILSVNVTEVYPVVAEPDSDSQSRNTSNDQFHPGTRAIVSDALSTTSTDASLPVSYCPFLGCNKGFTGRYGKGNLGRHYRQKHKDQVAQYPCELCGTVFLRTDALRKHQRKVHP